MNCHFAKTDFNWVQE